MKFQPYHDHAQTWRGAALGWHGDQSVLFDRQTTADGLRAIQTGLAFCAIVEFQKSPATSSHGATDLPATVRFS
jgi:hypothetical protein